MMGASGLVEEKCRMTMIHHDMDISRIMAYPQKIEESKFKKKNKEVKRARTGDWNFSNARFDGQSQLRF